MAHPNQAPLSTEPTTAGRAAEPSDVELIQRTAQHDRDAFQVLYQRYERLLYSLALRITANRHTAEEALQETLTRIWCGADTFKAEGNFRAWMIKILVRECLKKKQKPSGPIAGMSLHWIDSGGSLPPWRTYTHHLSYKLPVDTSMIFESFVHAGFIVSTPREKDRFNAVHDYGREDAGAGLALKVHGLALERLSLEEVDIQELPTLLQEPQRLRREIHSDSKNWTVTRP